MHSLGKTMCWVTCVLLLAASCAGRLAAAQEAKKGPVATTGESNEKDGAPRADKSSGGKLTKVSPRELLVMLGLGDDFFAGFADGKPVDPAEREKLLTLLFQLPRIPRPALEGAARSPAALGRLRTEPAARRGEVFHLRVGRAQRVVCEKLPEELKARFGFDHFYRCQALLAGGSCEIYALAVPAAWKLNRSIDEECSAWGMFVKELPKPIVKERDADERDESENLPGAAAIEAESVSPLLFVADRVAWHPATLLGYLGVDYGLFDQVRDRTPLTEREVFYQMLGAASRMSGDYLQFQIKRLIKDERATLERLVRNRDLPAKMRADAERGWARAQEGASDVAPLFDDPAIIKRFGIKRYYEIDIVTPDSQGRPLVCCVARIPSGMPLGNEIHEQVKVAGFFLKLRTIDTQGSDTTRDGKPPSGESEAPHESTERQSAPLLVATTIEVLTPVRFKTPTQSLQLAAGLLVVIAGFGLTIWYAGHGDRRVPE